MTIDALLNTVLPGTPARTALDDVLGMCDELRDNATADVATITRHEERIAELEADLAKQSRTPDGTLIVLGETPLWTATDCGRPSVGVPWSLWIADGRVFCRAVWKQPGGGEVALPKLVSDCYGSAAALEKAEATDGAH